MSTSPLPPPPAGSRDGGTAGKSGADAVWRKFRAWPVWVQAVGWLFLSWALVAILIWRSSLSTAVKTVGTIAIGVVLVAAVSAQPATAPQGGDDPPGAAATAAPSAGSPSTAPPSTDAASIVVPKVRGMKAVSAMRHLRALGLSVRVKTRISRASPGTVLSQSPASGARLTLGRTVVLVIAKAPPPPLPGRCPSNPLMGVYHPYRLRVLATCQTYEGVVIYIRHEDDGDYHVVVRPDPGFARFLDADNYSQQHGGLVTEIMPGQNLGVPYVGEHVAELGTWVYDSDHGWQEIHPIWSITDLGTGQTLYSLPPATPRYVHGAGGGSTGGSGGYPAGVTAICMDGTYSYSQHASGTCSYHGGVKVWIHHP